MNESVGVLINVITMMAMQMTKNAIGKNKLTLIGRGSLGRVFLNQRRPITVIVINMYSDKIVNFNKTKASSMTKHARLNKLLMEKIKRFVLRNDQFSRLGPMSRSFTRNIIDIIGVKYLMFIRAKNLGM